MAKPIATPTAFSPVAPPWSLTSLDANFTSFLNAFNDYSTYNNYLTDTSGVANTVTVNTPSGTSFAYSAGIIVQVKVANTTTAAGVTLNVNSLGAKTVKNPDGTTPAIAQLVSGGIYEFQYDGTNFQIIGGTPGGFTGFANPTASVGLAAVNGSATTAMRSDASPALSTGISPNWTAGHIFSGGFRATATQSASTATSAIDIDVQSANAPRVRWTSSTGAADAKYWEQLTNATQMVLRIVNDAYSTSSNFLSVVRSGVAISSLTFGNSTDNPTFTFSGTGISSFAGAISSTVSGDGSASAIQVSAATPSLGLKSTSGGADAKQWSLEASATQFAVNAFNDANSVARAAWTVTRSGVGLTDLSFGNATDNPTFTFLGTGQTSLSGTLSISQATGTILLNSSTTTNNNDFELRRGGVADLLFGSVGTNGQLITGSLAGDVCARVQGGNLIVSTNSGTSIGFKVSSANGAIQARGPVAAALVDMTPDSGTFTITYTGFAANPTATAKWVRMGNLVILMIPAATGTSNASTFTGTGLPAAIQPATTQDIPFPNGQLEDNNTAQVNCLARVNAGSGTIDFGYNGNMPTTWNAANTKGIIANSSISYLLT